MEGGHILGSAGLADNEDVAEYGICCVTHKGYNTCGAQVSGKLEMWSDGANR